jgi:hypothetical protein
MPAIVNSRHLTLKRSAATNNRQYARSVRHPQSLPSRDGNADRRS